MAIKIANATYYSISDIQEKLGVTRQTLWRWRKARKIPQGLRYRNLRIVFTEKEAEAIRKYASRLEPVEQPISDQNKRKNTNQPRQRK